MSIIERIGIAFPDLALQYSQGASADVSGWLGYLEEDELPAGYNAVWDLDVGDTVIIELEREFALVRVYDVTFLEVNRLSVAIQEILVNKQPLSEILDDYIGENSLFIRLVR